MNELIRELRELEKKLISEWLKPRTVFAAMFYGTLCYLILKQFTVPEILREIVSFLLGFYFGQKLPEQQNGKENKQ